jgi:DNA-binding response OmpR family regulator
MAKILLIDDDESVRTLLRLSLKHFGHSAIEASDGMEGLKLFYNHRPDLVIIDIAMPEKEGIDVLLELSKIQPLPKIIAISGGGRLGAQGYLRMAKLLGTAKVLTKPIPTAMLIAAVHEMLPRDERPAFQLQPNE